MREKTVVAGEVLMKDTFAQLLLMDEHDAPVMCTCAGAVLHGHEGYHRSADPDELEELPEQYATTMQVCKAANTYDGLRAKAPRHAGCVPR